MSRYDWLTGKKKQVSSNLNAGERTIQGFIDVIEASGWKFSHIQRLSANKMFWPSIIAEPNPDYDAGSAQY